MVSYGYSYAGSLLVGAAIVTWLAGWPWAIPFVILAVFCLNFFRDPERQVPDGPVAASPPGFGDTTLVSSSASRR